MSCGIRHKESLQQQSHNESALKNMKLESEISPDNEMLDLLSTETPKTPTACQEGTDETLTKLDKIFSSKSEEALHPKNLQQLVKRTGTSVLTATNADPKQFVCSKTAREISKAPPMGAAVSNDKIKTNMDQEMQEHQRPRGLESNSQTPTAGGKQGRKKQENPKLHVGLTDNPAQVRTEALVSESFTSDYENMFSFIVKSAEQKMDQHSMMPLVKHYTSGQMFTALLPDGTGQVCYPSGRLAILVAVAQSDDWFCVVVLEDEQTPRVQAVFTNRGRGACYYENGSILLNLTLHGGIYCSETGEVRKQWSWQENKHHVHAPPWKSLSLKLNPNVNIHIKSQEYTCIHFTSGKCSAQLNVGVKPKLNRGKGLMMLESDKFLRYLKQKSAEINVLLQNIQSLTTYRKSVSPQKVKPQQSLISQMERQQLPVKQQPSAKKTP